MRQESNLLILGNISDDLFRLKESQLFSQKETENLINFLINIIKDDDEDDDDFDSGIFSKKNRKMPILNNNIIFQSQNPIISPQTNIIPNNNNLKVNKTKLNNIFVFQKPNDLFLNAPFYFQAFHKKLLYNILQFLKLLIFLLTFLQQS